MNTGTKVMARRSPHDAPLISSLRGARGRAVVGAATLTPMRQRVLDLLRQADEPIGAYALRSRLEQVSAHKVSPPTVYRALDFLQRAGLASRIESRNAWIARESSDLERPLLLCVCSCCGCVVEAPAAGAHADLLKLAERRGFQTYACTLEVSGRCAGCRGESA